MDIRNELERLADQFGRINDEAPGLSATFQVRHATGIPSETGKPARWSAITDTCCPKRNKVFLSPHVRMLRQPGTGDLVQLGGEALALMAEADRHLRGLSLSAIPAPKLTAMYGPKPSREHWLHQLVVSSPESVSNVEKLQSRGLIVATVDRIAGRCCEFAQRMREHCEGPFTDESGRKLLRVGCSVSEELTGPEYSLIEVLWQHLGSLVELTELSGPLTGNDDAELSYRSIQSYVTRIRKKITKLPVTLSALKSPRECALLKKNRKS